MTARGVRRIVLAICAVGIAGMVAGSVSRDNDLALAFGLLTAAAVACLIVATSVAGSTLASPEPGDDERAQRVEGLVEKLVGGGADEDSVRALVQESVALGEGRSAARRRSPRAAPEAEAGAGVHGGRTPRPGGGTFT